MHSLVTPRSTYILHSLTLCLSLSHPLIHSISSVSQVASVVSVAPRVSGALASALLATGASHGRHTVNRALPVDTDQDSRHVPRTVTVSSASEVNIKQGEVVATVTHVREVSTSQGREQSAVSTARQGSTRMLDRTSARRVGLAR
jgi:hypothetical protein